MNNDPPDPNDPIQQDAKTIADNAADLSQTRAKELAEKADDASLSQQIERLDAERAAAAAAQAKVKADVAADQGARSRRRAAYRRRRP